MPGLFDLHALIALQNGWERFSGQASVPADQDTHGLANFTRHFPMVEASVVTSWFNGLAKDSNVTFRSFASPGHDDFPLVVLQLASEQSHTDLIKKAAREWEDGVPSQYVDVVVVSQEVEITIMTKAHELTRALFEVCRAILLRYTPQFLGAGYVDVKYLNSQELAPEERLISEDAGVYVRKMRWRAISHAEAFPIESSVLMGSVDRKPWWVLHSDTETINNPTPPPDRAVSTSGTPGGVVPK